jgi:hypothetical protein
MVHEVDRHSFFVLLRHLVGLSRALDTRMQLCVSGEINHISFSILLDINLAAHWTQRKGVLTLLRCRSIDLHTRQSA